MALATRGRCGTGRTGGCRTRPGWSRSSGRRAPSRRRPAAAWLVTRGEVAAGVGLRPALAPQVLGARPCAGRMWSCCSGVPNSKMRRGEQEDAVLRDPRRRRRPGSTPPRRAATPTARRRGRRAPRATTPPPTGRRTAAAPSRGAGRSPRGCRRTRLAAVAGPPLGQVARSARPAPRPGRRPPRRSRSRSIRRPLPGGRGASGWPRPRPRCGRGARPRSGSSSTTPVTWPVGRIADLGLAVDHRRLDEHRGVGRHGHLAPA